MKQTYDGGDKQILVMEQGEEENLDEFLDRVNKTLVKMQSKYVHKILDIQHQLVVGKDYLLRTVVVVYEKTYEPSE